MYGALPKPEVEKKFEEYRHYLVYEATRLTSFVALFRKLHERSVDRLEEINIAPAFFQMSTEALLAAIILWVDKLLKERGERGIFDFLSFIESNLKILEVEQLKRRKNYPNDHWMLRRDPITLETIKEDRKRIQRLTCLQNFKTLRDKFYAHFDKEYFFDRERMREMAPTWGDLDEVVEVISQVINQYSAA
ncbi:MAG: hypothetical protein ABIP82_06775 [Nitrospirales bacterium]